MVIGRTIRGCTFAVLRAAIEYDDGGNGTYFRRCLDWCLLPVYKNPIDNQYNLFIPMELNKILCALQWICCLYWDLALHLNGVKMHHGHHWRCNTFSSSSHLNISQIEPITLCRTKFFGTVFLDHKNLTWYSHIRLGWSDVVYWHKYHIVRIVLPQGTYLKHLSIQLSTRPYLHLIEKKTQAGRYAAFWRMRCIHIWHCMVWVLPFNRTALRTCVSLWCMAGTGQMVCAVRTAYIFM